MKFSFLLIALCSIPSLTNAADWSMTYGVHDFFVREKSSHTFGADLGILGEKITDSGTHLNGSFTAFLANDQDKLDPDYEPIWYKTDVQATGELYPLTSHTGFDWLVRFDGKINTPSGIEKQHKLFAGFDAHYTTSTINLSLKSLVGYYFLEIDDDVPLERGYATGDLQNKTIAYSVIADSKIKLNSKFNAYARIQQYRDNDQWLENQYELMINHDVAQWIQSSTLTLSAEHTQYNLDPYQKTGLTPILPWNCDTLVRLYLSVAI
jgi:hypothetical protein